MSKVECGDDLNNYKKHAAMGASLVDAWDHIVEFHPEWSKQLMGKSDEGIRREIRRNFRGIEG